VLAKLGRKDPLLDIAKALEEAALKDGYFVERKLYPNVDFYSASSTARWASPRTCSPCSSPWGASPAGSPHWKEMMEDTSTKIARPRQIYTGSPMRDYVPMDKRGT